MGDPNGPVYLKNKYGRIVAVSALVATRLLKESQPGAPQARGFQEASEDEIKGYLDEHSLAPAPKPKRSRTKAPESDQ